MIVNTLTMEFLDTFIPWLHICVIIGCLCHHVTCSDVPIPTQISSPKPLTFTTPSREFRSPVISESPVIMTRLSEIISKLQKWTNDISLKPKQEENKDENAVQRFLCFGDGIFCKELLYINNDVISGGQYEHAYDDKGSDPGQIYLPVGFLSPLPVPQTEEMYEKLNRDRSYRSSYIPATVRQRESIKETLPTF